MKVKCKMNLMIGVLMIGLMRTAVVLAQDTVVGQEALNEFAQSNSTKVFTGSPITLQLKDAELREVLRMIGDASGFNIIIHPAVTGKLSLSLEQVPWDQALEVVLNSMGLAAERSKSVLRVMPRDVLIAEKQREMDVRRASNDAAPRVTRIFPVSYADLSALVSTLQTFLNTGSKTGGSGSSAIISDVGTHSLIVRDSAENIERIRKMIELLDVQTPQVLIEAKVVEASEDFSKNFQGGLGAGGSSFMFGANGGDPSGSLAGLPAPSAGGMAMSAGTYIGIPPSGQAQMRLRAILNMSEQENRVKVVSSPKIVVLSGKTANISQQQTANIKVITTVAGGTTTETVQQISADTRLNVSPRVTNDGSVFLKLDLARGILRTPQGAQAYVEPRTMNTEVIVESGSTLVIGGVLSSDESEGESGFPFLRKIPLIGWLFGGENKSSRKSELMFFVTPRVLNPKRTNLQMGDAG